MAIYNPTTLAHGDPLYVDWGNQIRDNSINNTDDIHPQYSMSMCNGFEAGTICPGIFNHKIAALEYRIHLMAIRAAGAPGAPILIVYDMDGNTLYSNTFAALTAGSSNIYYGTYDFSLSGVTADTLCRFLIGIANADSINFNLCRAVTVAS